MTLALTATGMSVEPRVRQGFSGCKVKVRLVFAYEVNVRLQQWRERDSVTFTPARRA